MFKVIENMPSGYAGVLDAVRRYGVKQESRNGPVLEVLGACIDITDPQLCGLTGIGRGANMSIPIVEALCLISGESYPELLSNVSGRKFDNYRDGQVLHGAYGPRLRTQLAQVVPSLIDSESRRAVVMIWNPTLDLDERHDLPCTTQFQFLLRDEMLHMVTTMRSNDVYLGFPYDIFQFAQLQATIANVIGVEVGTMHHRVGSMHLYTEHLDKSTGVIERDANVLDLWSGIQSAWWDDARNEARWALEGKAIAEDRLLISGAETVMTYGVS